MLCTYCTNEAPDGSPSCPKCGRRFPHAAPAAPASHPAPAANAFSTDEAARLRAFSQEQLLSFQKLTKRVKRIAIPVGFVAGVMAFFLVMLVVGHEAKHAFSFAGILGILLGGAVDIFLEVSLLPRLLNPTLPCPYCSRPLPIMIIPSVFRLLQPFEKPKACPHCRYALPH